MITSEELRQNYALKQAGFRLTVREDWNDNAPAWAEQARHYRLTLSREGRRMSFWFYQGLGITREPDLAGVVESLLLDYSIGQYSLDEYGDEFGWNRDTISTHKQVRSIAWRFERVCGGAEQVEQVREMLEGSN